ncbi:MAG: ParA family protein [Verrucomicrobiaceae bacterium]|nr:MAG: ParA family protein [Verrucomicrobiaceae bacterium]
MRRMKIAVCNQKGGSGKTTAAMLLAYALGTAGRSVGLIDRDPQQTACRWLETAPGEGVEMARPGISYDFVIIDTPGYARDPGFVQAIREADKVLLVCSTSPVDVWSTQAAANFMQSKRPDLRPLILFSRFVGHTGFGKSSAAFAKALGLRALKHAIPERQCIQRASLHGYSALPLLERSNLANLAIEVITAKP